MEKSEYRKIFEAGFRAGLERAAEICDAAARKADAMHPESPSPVLTAACGQAVELRDALRAEMDKK